MEIIESTQGQFRRYENSRKLSKTERANLLNEYLEFYRGISVAQPDLLNQKIPREAFGDFLSSLGFMLNVEAERLSREPGPAKEFLEQNPLPISMAERLPTNFRAFCLLLNALKQWVNAEQAATDRFLLGSNVRGEIKEVASGCIITGASLDKNCELHHPVRDGRPPLPLSKTAHAKLEGQIALALKADEEDSILLALQPIRGKQSQSWANLYRGCLELMGESVIHTTPAVRAGALHFARVATREAGLQPSDLVDWLLQTGRVKAL